LSSAKATSYGFLSGSVEALKLAATAKQVRIELTDGRILDARVLQVNPIGFALVTTKVRTQSVVTAG
jgi:hypothetical protein